MWPKTLTGFFLGLLISISVMLNISQSLPLPVDIRLLAGLLIAFPLWGGVMTYCYYINSTKRAALSCCKLLAVSVLLNFVQMYSGL